VPTADGALFLKQCAPVQAFEVPLTAALASRWPDRLPEVVAADERRAWLLLRDGGVRLREHGLEPFPAALRLYAELQVAETAHVASPGRPGRRGAACSPRSSSPRRSAASRTPSSGSAS
ncbi:MAG TPA: hypothetical protein VLN26_18180, partial [Gaiellaceae bacterium]|nr:hypothetical protein [Gaiellaceae bacterium]